MQVFIPDTFLDEFYTGVMTVEAAGEQLPRTFQWPAQRLALTVLPDTQTV